MDYIKVAQVDDFADTNHRSYRILAKYIGVFKKPDGTFYAIEAGCKHAHANLLEGRVQNGLATCPRHGWQYNMSTGECVRGQGGPLRRHDLRIEEGAILVSVSPVETPVNSSGPDEQKQDEFNLDNQMAQ